MLRGPGAHDEGPGGVVAAQKHMQWSWRVELGCHEWHLGNSIL